MAAVICDGACKCSECEHHKRDTERNRTACFARPDKFGCVHAQRKLVSRSGEDIFIENAV